MEKGQGQGNFTLCTVQGSLNNVVVGFQHLKQNPHNAIAPSISVDLRKQPLANCKDLQAPCQLQGRHHAQTTDPSSCEPQVGKEIRLALDHVDKETDWKPGPQPSSCLCHCHLQEKMVHVPCVDETIYGVERHYLLGSSSKGHLWETMDSHGLPGDHPHLEKMLPPQYITTVLANSLRKQLANQIITSLTPLTKSPPYCL